MTTTAATPSAEPDPSEGSAAHAASGAARELASLRGRVAELERERDQLVAVVDIQREMAAAATYVDVLQAIVRILGRSFALDRCSIYLAGTPGEARLVASFENPAIRNLVVDLARYPELRRALEGGEPVFIADAAQDAALAPARDALALRNVGAIAVVPMRWRSATIGAIYLRSDRDAPAPLSEPDVRFCQVVAALAAQALHNARQAGGGPRLTPGGTAVAPPAGPDAERTALLAFIRRLLERHASAAPGGAAALLPRTEEELDRLVEVALRVIGDDATR
jgi:uncharacterized protein YigA (DUF484 family)